MATVEAARCVGRTLATRDQTRRTALALAAVLTALLVGQVVAPGFTDYWGWQVGRVAVTLAVVMALEAIFAAEGGLTGLTLGLAVGATLAETLGTAGHLYATFASYDKLTHFASFAMITAAVYDLLAALARRGVVAQPPTRRLLLAFAIGMATGIGWEIYEYVGDKVVHLGARIGDGWDTTTDLLADAAGAGMAGLILWRRERERGRRWLG